MAEASEQSRQRDQVSEARLVHATTGGRVPARRWRERRKVVEGWRSMKLGRDVSYCGSGAAATGQLRPRHVAPHLGGTFFDWCASHRGILFWDPGHGGDDLPGYWHHGESLMPHRIGTSSFAAKPRARCREQSPAVGKGLDRAVLREPGVLQEGMRVASLTGIPLEEGMKRDEVPMDSTVSTCLSLFLSIRRVKNSSSV